MELPNKLGGMLKVIGRLPGRLMLTIPLNVVLELFLLTAGVEDFLNFVLDITVNDNWRWWWLNLARKRVRDNRLQE